MKRTRAQLAEFLTGKGFPISKYTLDQLCKPSAGGAGPPSVGRWGRGDLYDDEPALEWAVQRALAAKEQHAKRFVELREHVPKRNMPTVKPRSRRRA